MRFRRVGGLTAIVAAMIICISCGQIYRPVVIPISVVPPNSQGFHQIFSVNVNVPFNFGSAMQIDVSGDSEIGAAFMGVNPTHGAILPNDSRVFIANAGSQDNFDADSVMSFFPATDSRIATGLGTPTVYSLPFGSLPVFINTAQNNAVFVANYGTNSVNEINPATNAIIPLTGIVGSHPIAMAETPNALNLYVADEGDNTVYNLSPIDLSTQAIIPNVGNTPTWIVSRIDGQRVYVVTQGDGNLYTINTTTNAIMSTQRTNAPGAKPFNAGKCAVFTATKSPPLQAYCHPSVVPTELWLAGVGWAVVPPVPPLKLTRLALWSITTVRL